VKKETVMPNRTTHRIFRTLLLLLAVTQPVFGATFPTGGPRSTNNDDSCDISQQPAATLLLPYFEVDLSTRQGETTIFTITNVADEEIVARITLWTDYAYPVVNFNVYLTGYDVQSINLYDVLALGQIAPPRGTGFEDTGSPIGDFADKNDLVDRETCRNLPMQVAPVYRTRMQQAFTQGKVAALGLSLPACENIGGTHVRAVGYATIDVVRKCGVLLPEQRQYFEDEILYANVLTGDYQQVNTAQDSAQSGPLVHVRAIPEGGTFTTRRENRDEFATNLERTFYGRYLRGGSDRIDARQPLPSIFAARWIAGGPGAFQTHYKIWREGVPGSDASCETYSVNGHMDVAELVRFDEDENFFAFDDSGQLQHTSTLPATARVEIADDEVFPDVADGTLAGWAYLNLDQNPDDGIASQGWMVSSMRAAGRFSVDNDVTALGNGCTPATPVSEATTDDGPPIGPAPNFNQH
jgi:hypothetical protein